MKNKKYNPKTLSYKIWIEFAKILIILFIVLFILNITIIEKNRSDGMYEKLRAFAITSEYYDLEGVLDDNENSRLPVFFTIKLNESRSIIEDIVINDFAKETYFHHLLEDQILNKISNLIVKDTDKHTQGKISHSFSDYYYYSVLSDNNTITVYVLKTNDSILDFFIMLILIGVLLSFLFIISRNAAKKIAAPIQELKGFATEIASKNWDYSIELSDTVEVNDLIYGLKEMSKSLKEADNREREFLQSVSHDLKTPVMIIKGYIEAVKDGKYNTEDIEFLNIITDESNRLERKIIQLLRLNALDHVQRDKSTWEEVSIDRMIKNLVKKYKIICPNINWQLNLQQLEIIGDVESLLVAFENILDNQIRFAKKQIKIHISNKNEIIISNDGPLISIENPEDLFESHTKDKQGNFGLGLAIVKRVIRIHDGDIHVSNSENGVEFSILFNRSTNY
ncbi:sensor histidine kinase [Vallitalea okinawensis]|uniref:sensor histidine kinase n=1 Tax=Vallitalea okinawensis TaxID=2078660 RepID=UPI000CFC5195|nr:HAMP domain-containing sensor histidine kinase [Vallitalea okinawensis]